MSSHLQWFCCSLVFIILLFPACDGRHQFLSLTLKLLLFPVWFWRNWEETVFQCALNTQLLYMSDSWTSACTVWTVRMKQATPLCLNRFLRSATPRQLQSSATTRAMTSSPAWFLQTLTRLRPCWTSSLQWAGTMCPHSPLRETMERAVLKPSSRSPESPVRNLKMFFRT